MFIVISFQHNFLSEIVESIWTVIVESMKTAFDFVLLT